MQNKKCYTWEIQRISKDLNQRFYWKEDEILRKYAQSFSRAKPTRDGYLPLIQHKLRVWWVIRMAVVLACWHLQLNTQGTPDVDWLKNGRQDAHVYRQKACRQHASTDSVRVLGVTTRLSYSCPCSNPFDVRNGKGYLLGYHAPLDTAAEIAADTLQRKDPPSNGPNITV